MASVKKYQKKAKVIPTTKKRIKTQGKKIKQSLLKPVNR